MPCMASNNTLIVMRYIHYPNPAARTVALNLKAKDIFHLLSSNRYWPSRRLRRTWLF